MCLPFVDMLMSITQHKSSPNINNIKFAEQISKLAGQFLQHSWNIGKMRHESITCLLEVYVEYSPRPLKLIGHLAELLVKEGQGGSGKLSEYGTLNPTTFPSYYTALLASLITSFFNTNFKGDNILMLQKMSKLAELFTSLLQIAKQDNIHYNVLVCALKKGKQFVEFFIKHVLPMFRECFSNKQAECMAILRTVQRGTRVIQTLCAHGKLLGAKNTKTLLTLIPNVKKAMESLIFSVKELLESLDCSDAFSLGILKHRGITGEELSSQDLAYTSVPANSKQKKKKHNKETQNDSV